MNAITVVILIFVFLGAADKLLGDRFGLGKEFEKGFALFAPMALAMPGMLVIAPALGAWLKPFFGWFYEVFGIDPSILPASLFANDMGGAALANTVCRTEAIGKFNGYVVASMMGCVVSFTIPFALGVVKKEQHREMFFGMLCGITTIPVGSVVAGLMCGIGFLELLLSLLPLIIFCVLLGVALVLFPNACIKAFVVFGHIIRFVSLSGLVCAIFTFLTKIVICPEFDSFENAAFVCVNASVTLCGALPFMFAVSKLLRKPLEKAGAKLGINADAAAALLATLVTNATAFGIADKMNKKGVVLNSAFAVSAAFALGGHLAFTMALEQAYVIPVIVGKLVSGACALLLALVLYKEQPQK